MLLYIYLFSSIPVTNVAVTFLLEYKINIAVSLQEKLSCVTFSKLRMDRHYKNCCTCSEKIVARGHVIASTP